MHNNILQLVALRLPDKDLANFATGSGFTATDYFWMHKLTRMAPGIFKFIHPQTDNIRLTYRKFSTYLSTLKNKDKYTLKTITHDYKNINDLLILQYITFINPADLQAPKVIRNIINKSTESKSLDMLKWIIQFKHDEKDTFVQILIHGTFDMITYYYEKNPGIFTRNLYIQDHIYIQNHISSHDKSDDEDERVMTIYLDYFSQICERHDAISVYEFIYEKMATLPSNSLYRSFKVHNEKIYLWLLDHEIVPKDGRINYALINFFNIAEALMVKYNEKPNAQIYRYLYTSMNIEVLNFLAVQNPPVLPEKIADKFSSDSSEDYIITILEWAQNNKIAIDIRIFYFVLFNFDYRRQFELFDWFINHDYTPDQNLLDCIFASSTNWYFPPDLCKPTVNGFILAFNNHNYEIIASNKKLFPDVYTAFIGLIPTDKRYFIDPSGIPHIKGVRMLPLQEFPASPLLIHLKPHMLNNNTSIEKFIRILP